MNSRRKEVSWIGLVGILLAILFIAVPSIDLLASGVAFHNGVWLLERDSPWLYPIYVGLPRLGQLLFVAIALLWVLSRFDRFGKLYAQRQVLTFLLIGIIIGPVLVVDVGLKDHSGRARPINAQEFGGAKLFTPAFIPADQCTHNCSFVSGHVVGTSFLMAFGWLGTALQRRRWLVGSLVAASVVGIARIIPGGHFLSDVLFAWLFVYFSLWLTEGGLRLLGWKAHENREQYSC